MEEFGIHYTDLNPVIGHEQGGTRPVIIVKLLKELDLCMVIPLTSVSEHINLPYTVQVNKTLTTNLKENSVALVFHLRTISSIRIKDKIGTAEEYQMKKIKSIIKTLFSIE